MFPHIYLLFILFIHTLIARAVTMLSAAQVEDQRVEQNTFFEYIYNQ